jgi:AraC-like DNA-binding protein
MEGNDPNERVSVPASLDFLKYVTGLTGDEDLGLRAALEVNQGDFDVLEYAASSCRDGHEAMAVVFRYIDLVNEVADFSLEVKEGKGYVWLKSKIRLPRASNDYQVATFYRVIERWIGADRPRYLEVWFEHPEPADTSIYREIFGDIPILFGTSANAILFDPEYLNRPLRSAEPRLHEVLRRQADQLLASLPRHESVTSSVRKLVLDNMNGRKVSIEEVARRMHVSRRTLHRQLAAEGITYKKLVDDLRRLVALQHLEKRRLGVDEIAFLLGFSDSAAFYRAFKRWTGRTPQEYLAERG